MVSKSSTKVEYHVVAYTMTETTSLWYPLTELGIILTGPVKELRDNISATFIAVNPVLHNHSKHIKVDYHFSREWMVHGDLVVHYVPTRQQLADIFTKASSVDRFLSLKSNLSVELPIQIEGAVTDPKGIFVNLCNYFSYK